MEGGGPEVVESVVLACASTTALPSYGHRPEDSQIAESPTRGEAPNAFEAECPIRVAVIAERQPVLRVRLLKGAGALASLLGLTRRKREPRLRRIESATGDEDERQREW